jgi:hypothetical protein
LHFALLSGIGQQYLVSFLQLPALASHWLDDLNTVHQRQKEMTNIAPPTLSEALVASLTTFVIA